jgi:hypothetical protein
MLFFTELHDQRADLSFIRNVLRAHSIVWWQAGLEFAQSFEDGSAPTEFPPTGVLRTIRSGPRISCHSMLSLSVRDLKLGICLSEL